MTRDDDDSLSDGYKHKHRMSSTSDSPPDDGL
jgi:hypothetical protein